MVQNADDDAEENLSSTQTGADACTTCTPPPECQEKNDKVKKLRDEIEQRDRDLKIDQYDLFNRAYLESYPLVVGGMRIGSWQGHVRQFRQK